MNVSITLARAWKSFFKRGAKKKSMSKLRRRIKTPLK